ncbi:MAG: 4-hydroxy-tetrahydrodipicolinate reductase [Bacteroidetes bacterium]|nr:4-hydroxy-tetrahydrodipicolinate reductase [Bacteroidota bacterium]
MRIALFGYGKMGKEIEQIALHLGHEIALKIDVNNINSITKEDLQKCDAAIEFSTPHTAISNMNKCFEAGIPIVVGTTGWYDKADEVKKTCNQKNGCLFYASNFSIGVNIFFKVNEQLAKMMNNYSDYNVSVEEIHHIHKLDAPSGTALSLANQITDNLSRKSKWINTKTNNAEELEIISKREGEVPGTHIVKYFSTIDDIEIRHTAHNRKGFALGAVMAAEFVKGKNGVFGMNDMMKL